MTYRAGELALTTVAALEAEIARQDSIIRGLERRVRELEYTVAARDRTIYSLRRVVAGFVVRAMARSMGRIGSVVLDIFKRKFGGGGGHHGKIGRWPKGHRHGTGGRIHLPRKDNCLTWKNPNGGCAGAGYISNFFGELAEKSIGTLVNKYCPAGICSKIPGVKQGLEFFGGIAVEDYLEGRRKKCGATAMWVA